MTGRPFPPSEDPVGASPPASTESPLRPLRQVSLSRLAEFGITPKRSLGQNFLIDDNIVGVILQRLEARPDDVVIEVGAGLGVLTRALAGVSRLVHAFEIDRSLEAALGATLAGIPGDVRVHLEDVLRAPLEGLEPVPTLCASNLPYSVAAPFLAESLVRLPRVRRYVVMVQREVADRLASRPGSKTYGGLSVWVQLLAEVRDVRPLSRAVFYPQPRVDSALVTLERRVPEGVLAERPALVRRVIDASFAQRRKTLQNSLGAELGLDKTVVAEALDLVGLVPGVRAERVSPAVFPRLCEKLLQLLA